MLIEARVAGSHGHWSLGLVSRSQTVRHQSKYLHWRYHLYWWWNVFVLDSKPYNQSPMKTGVTHPWFVTGLLTLKNRAGLCRTSGALAYGRQCSVVRETIKRYKTGKPEYHTAILDAVWTSRCILNIQYADFVYRLLKNIKIWKTDIAGEWD